MSVLFGLLQFMVPVVFAEETPAGIPKGAEAATVSAVANGGTISVVLSDGSSRNVGLIGVSAPEVPTATTPGQCYGAESRSYLESLAVPGSVVYLEKDSKIQEKDETLLRFVWIVPADGGKAFLVNTKMVRDGYADVGQGGSDSKYADRLSDAESKAKDGDRGAWGICGQMHKENPQSPEQVKAQYEPVDIRDVSVRPGTYLDKKIMFSGSVLSINVARPGYGYEMEDRILTSIQLQCKLPSRRLMEAQRSSILDITAIPLASSREVMSRFTGEWSIQTPSQISTAEPFRCRSLPQIWSSLAN